jgi:hypothetical protein
MIKPLAVGVAVIVTIFRSKKVEAKRSGLILLALSFMAVLATLAQAKVFGTPYSDFVSLDLEYPYKVVGAMAGFAFVLSGMMCIIFPRSGDNDEI